MSAIVNGHAAITAEMAARMAAVLGTTAQYWLNLQNAVDLYDAQERLATSENRPQLMPVSGNPMSETRTEDELRPRIAELRAARASFTRSRAPWVLR